MQGIKTTDNIKTALFEFLQELSTIVKEKCLYLDMYQQFILAEAEFDYFSISYEIPYSPFEFKYRGNIDDKNEEEQKDIVSTDKYQKFNVENRKGLNESCYKEIFFILNRILNNDSKYDNYIKMFRSSLLSELNLYIVNNYFEMVKKELEKLIKYTYVNPSQITTPLDIIDEVDELCAKYGIDFVMAANEAIKGLLNKSDIKMAENNIYNQSLDQLIKGDFIVIKGDELRTYESEMPGVGRTIYEIQKHLTKKAIELGLDLENSSNFYTKLRNVGSHGEFEFNIQRLNLKNNQNIVISPSGNNYFTIQELNNISENIIAKISKIEGINPNLFSPMISPLFNILSGEDISGELDNLSTENEKIEMINLLISLSLFSTIQLNSENMFKYITDTQKQTYMDKIETVLPIKKTLINPTTNQKEETDTILGQGIDIEKIWYDFENIKNAIGHNNVYISFFNIICTNDYITFKRKRNNLNDVFLNSDDYIKRGAYVRIVFQIIDWIKYIADDNFFRMISMSVTEQSEHISRFKK